ncbi:hypothetical protein BJ165DRAFT_1482763 [Panaeolus papilionaceus]|nr:hypothetical protein BJ165DRAFT_1482763 [Panaeolus papilionaceus]
MHFSSLLVVAIVAISAAARVAVPEGDLITISRRGTEVDMVGGGEKPASPAHGASSSSGSDSEDGWDFFADSADAQLDRLGLANAAERTSVQKEHMAIVDAQLKSFDATHYEINKLAHAKGSDDPKIHITATLYGNRKNKSGAVTNIKLPSNFAGEKGTFHHIYVNLANPVDGLSVVKAKMPVYYSVLQRKQGKKPDQAPEI